MWSEAKLKDMADAEAAVFGRSRALDEVVTEFARVQNETYMPYDIASARRALEARLPEVAKELMQLPAGDRIIEELQAYWREREKAREQDAEPARERNALRLGRGEPARDADRDAE